MFGHAKAVDVGQEILSGLERMKLPLKLLLSLGARLGIVAALMAVVAQGAVPPPTRRAPGLLGAGASVVADLVTVVAFTPPLSGVGHEAWR